MDQGRIDWVLAQPLGIAVLMLVLLAFVTDYIVTGKALRREQERADRLEQTNDTLSKAVEKSAETNEKALSGLQLVLNILQGIDSHLRSERNRGQ